MVVGSGFRVRFRVRVRVRRAEQQTRLLQQGATDEIRLSTKVNVVNDTTRPIHSESNLSTKVKGCSGGGRAGDTRVLERTGRGDEPYVRDMRAQKSTNVKGNVYATKTKREGKGRGGGEIKGVRKV